MRTAYSTRLSLQLVIIPCYQASPNTVVDMTADKTIAIVGVHNYNGWDGVGLHAYLGVSTLTNSTTGIKQVASYSATSFYVSGNGASASGFVYVANLSTNTVIPIVGQSSGQPGYLDARGVGIFSGNLYGTSGDSGPSCPRCNTVFKIASGFPVAGRCVGHALQTASRIDATTHS